MAPGSTRMKVKRYLVPSLFSFCIILSHTDVIQFFNCVQCENSQKYVLIQGAMEYKIITYIHILNAVLNVFLYILTILTNVGGEHLFRIPGLRNPLD
jgi:hypothetical protein